MSNQQQKDAPLWTAVNQVPTLYPWLSREERCQVLILGGGITGAFAARRFAQAGVDTVLLSGDPVGFGGTAASQGVMRGDANFPLREACGEWGSERAQGLYQLCARALDEIEALVAEEHIDCGFSRADDLQAARDMTHAEELKEEYLIRKHSGLDVEFLLSQTHQDLFSFDFEGALLVKNGAAVCDPFLLAHGLVRAAQGAGARIYEHSAAECIKQKNGAYQVTTAAGQTVTADTLILAIGAECSKFVPGCGSLRTCFSMATEPIEIFAGWPEKTVVRLCGRPEVTYSVTPDGRILAAGLQTGLIDRSGRLAGLIPLPTLYEKKYAQLRELTEELFPGIRGKQAAYTFSALSLETEDGLPLLGELREYPACYCAACGGGNGIVFSHIAADLLLELYEGKTPSLLHLFDPYR